MTDANTPWLAIPVPAREVYKRSPLVFSLCQVRFNRLLGVADEAEVNRFHKTLREVFPLAAPIENYGVEFEISPTGQSIKKNPGQLSWRFYDLEDNWAVVLSSDFVSLETRNYSTFSEFLERLALVTTGLLHTFKPAIILRIGLRYVDEIRRSSAVEGDWIQTIHKPLLGPYSENIFPPGAYQSVNQVNFIDDHNQGMNLQYGLLPQGSIVEPRAEDPTVAEEFFFLDFDVFQEFKPNSLLFSPSAVDSKVSQFHERIWSAFRWSVTDAYIQSLGALEE